MPLSVVMNILFGCPCMLFSATFVTVAFLSLLLASLALHLILLVINILLPVFIVIVSLVLFSILLLRLLQSSGLRALFPLNLLIINVKSHFTSFEDFNSSLRFLISSVSFCIPFSSCGLSSVLILS